MGYSNVKPVSYHGPDEKGIDIGPFYKNEFGQIMYYGIQAKSIKIHTNSRMPDGNIELILTQLRTALNNEFHVDTGSKIKLFNVFLITSKDISTATREYVNQNMSNVIMLDGRSISEVSEFMSLFVHRKESTIPKSE